MAVKVKINGQEATFDGQVSATFSDDKTRWMLKDDENFLYYVSVVSRNADNNNFVNCYVMVWNGTTYAYPPINADTLIDWVPNTIPQADMIRFLTQQNDPKLQGGNFTFTLKVKAPTDRRAGIKVHGYGSPYRSVSGTATATGEFSQLSYTFATTAGYNPGKSSWEIDFLADDTAASVEPVDGIRTILE